MAAEAPEEELGRLLCATADRRDRERARVVALAATVDPGRWATFAGQQRLAPLLRRRLDDAGLAHSAPARALVGTDRQDAMRALLFRGSEDLILGRLGEAGIPVLGLKGVELSRRLYGDDVLRPTSDVDLLVDAERLADAAAVVLDLGYRLVEGSLGRLPRLHLTFLDPTGNRPPVELHWRVHWYETSFSRALLARSRLVDGRRVPTATDDLASLLLFYHRDGFLGLRLAADLAALWDRRGGDVPAGALERIAVEHPGLRRALTTAAAVAERVVGLPAGGLLARAAPDRRGRLTTGLENWRMRGSADQIGADIMLVDALGSPRGDWVSAARRCLTLDGLRFELGPEASRADRVGLWVDRATHPVKVLVRFGLALVSVRRRAAGRLASAP